MNYNVGDKVIFCGDTTILGRREFNGQMCTFGPNYLTIGKEYEITKIDGDKTLWLISDNGQMYGYLLFECGGFYKFNELKVIRKIKLEKLNKNDK